MFGSLFGKETCAICGAEVGAPKKRKLADGTMCADCAANLSPFFEDRKGSTVQDIKDQLTDREANKARLATFSASKIFGDNGVVLIDEEAGTFVAVADTSDGFFGSAKKVTSIKDVAGKNPDVIKISQVVDVDMDIIQTDHEEKQTVDGQQKSYSPRHMTYMCKFVLVVKVDHPYIETIRVPLESEAVKIRNEGERLRNSLGQQFKQWLFDSDAYDLQGASVYDSDSLLSAIMNSPYEMPDYSYGFKCSPLNRDDIRRYEYYLQMGAALRQALMPEA